MMNETAGKYIGRGACAKACPRQRAAAGSPYAIDPAHRLQRGRRVEFRPAGAVDRPRP